MGGRDRSTRDEVQMYEVHKSISDSSFPEEKEWLKDGRGCTQLCQSSSEELCYTQGKQGRKEKEVPDSIHSMHIAIAGCGAGLGAEVHLAVVTEAALRVGAVMEPLSAGRLRLVAHS